MSISKKRKKIMNTLLSDSISIANVFWLTDKRHVCLVVDTAHRLFPLLSHKIGSIKERPVINVHVSVRYFTNLLLVPTSILYIRFTEFLKMGILQFFTCLRQLKRLETLVTIMWFRMVFVTSTFSSERAFFVLSSPSSWRLTTYYLQCSKAKQLYWTRWKDPLRRSTI